MLYLIRKPLFSYFIVAVTIFIFGIDFYSSYTHRPPISVTTKSLLLCDTLPNITWNLDYVWMPFLLLIPSLLVYGIVKKIDIPQFSPHLSSVFIFIYALWYSVVAPKLYIEDALCGSILLIFCYYYITSLQYKKPFKRLFQSGISYSLFTLLQPLFLYSLPLFLIPFLATSRLSFKGLICFIGGICTTLIWTISGFYFFSNTQPLVVWVDNIFEYGAYTTTLLGAYKRRTFLILSIQSPLLHLFNQYLFGITPFYCPKIKL